ncbi:MAG: hypothetical protein M5U20_08240 [Phycisphaerales bacterium]|nr:hypothetical protein [Phycisphaerales bacterium]
MITAPNEQPPGTRFYVTRRPDIFWEQCAPCEEFVAGPYDTMDEAMAACTVARSQLERMGLFGAVGVFAARPGWTPPRPIVCRFPRGGDGRGGVVQNEQPTRLYRDEILRCAVERRESLVNPDPAWP